MFNFACLHHVLHELHGFWGHFKIGKASCKACHAQDTNGVFAKGQRYMAKYFVVEIFQAMKGVDSVLLKDSVSLRMRDFKECFGMLLWQGHGVDGQVAAGQIFFQRNFGRGMHHKAFVARRGFALSAG